MRKWTRRSFKICAGLAGLHLLLFLLLLGGMIYYSGGRLPVQAKNLEPGIYEKAWIMTTGHEIPEELTQKDHPVNPDRVKWSKWRNWVIYAVRPEGSKMPYLLVYDWCPLYADIGGFFARESRRLYKFPKEDEDKEERERMLQHLASHY